ncbi:MAG: DNA-binding transcriptional LysR family regulator [Oceanicoccus sp.]|jgi:DNA-binding transcriptional LysR family regulator
MMLYNNLPLLHVFHLVVDQGSFQGVAQHLDLPRSSVSKKMALPLMWWKLSKSAF